ncbi:MAG: DUF2807 domain-containing protein [Chloroflexi bacterium]|nr:DUF2807 domain-containing protein [Chloroflexota bacterium]
MRKTALLLVLTFLLAASTFLSACSGGFRFGNVITEKIEVSNFTGVEIDGPFEATLTQSDAFSVTISVQADFRDYASVVREGEILKISLKPRHPFTNFPVGTSTFKIKITMPALAYLNLSGATKGTISGFKSTGDFRLDISGASTLAMEDIEVGNADFQASGASRITGGLTAKDLTTDFSGASRTELRGSAESILISASGASNLNLLSMPVSAAGVKLSGASQVTLNVREKLDMTLADASRLDFQGNPAVGRMDISGASTVKHK